jgi:hypothetical protein
VGSESPVFELEAKPAADGAPRKVPSPGPASLEA